MYSFLYHFSTSRHSAGRASVSWPSTGHMFALSSPLYSSPTNSVFIRAEFGTNTTCRLMQDSWHIMSWLSCRFSVTLRPAAQSLSRCRVSCLIKMPHFTAPPPNRPSLLQHLWHGSPCKSYCHFSHSAPLERERPSWFQFEPWAELISLR